jgi:hypothetical protein
MVASPAIYYGYCLNFQTSSSAEYKDFAVTTRIFLLREKTVIHLRDIGTQFLPDQVVAMMSGNGSSRSLRVIPAGIHLLVVR